MENKSEAEDNLSRGTNGLKANQNPEDLGSSVEVEDEVDELEEGNEQAMAASNCEPDLILLYDKEISSLNTEALKAELNRRGLKKSGNKRTLVERLRAAKISEHISQAVGNDSKTSQVKENSVNAQLFIQDREIISFIEAKVREICCHEIEKLKAEASESYANETITTLQRENDTLKQRLREMEFGYASMKDEANNLNNENKSLMTVIRLLNNELQTALKADESFLGNVNYNQTTNTVKPNKTKRSQNKRQKEKKNTQEQKEAPNMQIEQPQAEQLTTLLIGDSMVKNIQGRKLGKVVGHRVVVKSFSGANTRAMSDYLKPNLELNSDQVILHVGTNDLKKKEPQEVAEAIVDLARQVERSSDAKVVISELVCRRDKLNEQVKAVNKRLKRYCQQKEWKLIQHNNVTEKGLNMGGLHLNPEGNQRFFNNFKSSLLAH